MTSLPGGPPGEIGAVDRANAKDSSLFCAMPLCAGLGRSGGSDLVVIFLMIFHRFAATAKLHGGEL